MEPRSRRISLRDVAKGVGVSHVTVSLALRHDPRIPKETRERIEAEANRLGYRPDPMLSSLAAYRTARHPIAIGSTIAWLNQWKDPKRLHGMQEFEAYWLGARACAERLGYRLEEFKLGEGLTGARLQKILLTRNTRGILIPPHPDGLALPDFDWSLFSVVRFGASVESPKVHMVTSDQMKCAAMAFREVHLLGYQIIGYVSSLALDRATKGSFRAGFLASQDEFVPARRRLAPLLLKDGSIGDDVRELRRWLKAHRPDAIVTTNAKFARMLGALGLSVPGDLAVATTSLLDGKFDSGVDQNSQEIGHVAMSTLAGLVQQNERGIPVHCRRILVEGRWVSGTSMPAKSGTAANEKTTP